MKQKEYIDIEYENMWKGTKTFQFEEMCFTILPYDQAKTECRENKDFIK